MKSTTIHHVQQNFIFNILIWWNDVIPWLEGRETLLISFFVFLNMDTMIFCMIWHVFKSYLKIQAMRLKCCSLPQAVVAPTAP